MKIAVCVISSTPPEILSDIYGDAVFSFSELSHKQYSFKYDENVIQLEPGDPVLCQVRSSYCYGKVIRTLQGNTVSRAAKYKAIIAKLNPTFLTNEVKNSAQLARLVRVLGNADFSMKLLQLLESHDIDVDDFLREF